MPGAPPKSTRALPIAPTEEQWRAMSPAERSRFIDEVNAALSDPVEAMAEGRPHARAKGDALDALRLYFSRTGRRIYVAQELSVVYPGEEPFAPDILAVLDVEEPEDDERMAWIVADEGRGLDLAIEICHQGNRDKDFVKNVERYARLGISEYILYDRLQQQLHVYRLPGPRTARYQKIRPRLGRHSSQVLGLDLAIFGGRVRFFNGPAELPLSGELIAKLESMMDDLEARHDLALAQLQRAEAQVQQIEAQVQQAEARARRARIEGILAVLKARSLPPAEEVQARIEACTDPALLDRWFARALEVATPEELFSGG
jgi:Uma2 family endonuclease